MLNRIDRYVLGLFFRFFLAGIVVFVTLYLIVDFMSFAVHHSNSPSNAFVRFYLYSIPAVVYQMVPVACLLSMVFTFSSLSRSHELVALFSFGMSLLRVAAPALGAVVGISVAAFFISDQVLPNFERKKNYVNYVEIEQRPWMYSTVTTNKIWYRSDNVIFNIKTLNTLERKAQGLTLYYFDEAWNLIQLITSADVDLQTPTWTLRKGTVTLFSPDSSFPLTQPFDTKQMTIREEVGDLSSAANSSNTLSLAELNRFISKNKEAGLDTLRYEVDFHSKFGFAFAAIVMSVLAIPFSVQRQRSGGAFINLAICLLLAFGYWILYSSAITLGQHGVIPPIVAAWGPNGVVILMAFYFIWRLRS